MPRAVDIDLLVERVLLAGEVEIGGEMDDRGDPVAELGGHHLDCTAGRVLQRSGRPRTAGSRLLAFDVEPDHLVRACQFPGQRPAKIPAAPVIRTTGFVSSAMNAHSPAVQFVNASPRLMFHANLLKYQSGTTAVASISTFASSSISATTCTMVIAGKCRP